MPHQARGRRGLRPRGTRGPGGCERRLGGRLRLALRGRARRVLPPQQPSTHPGRQRPGPRSRPQGPAVPRRACRRRAHGEPACPTRDAVRLRAGRRPLHRLLGQPRPGLPDAAAARRLGDPRVHGLRAALRRAGTHRAPCPEPRGRRRRGAALAAQRHLRLRHPLDRAPRGRHTRALDRLRRADEAPRGPRGRLRPALDEHRVGLEGAVPGRSQAPAHADLRRVQRPRPQQHAALPVLPQGHPGPADRVPRPRPRGLRGPGRLLRGRAAVLRPPRRGARPVRRLPARRRG
ncbi:MAG: hypothetical protein AVDCRST_MAG13-2079 [uncultured Solirubrobacteraceae bacterium]|uniref:Uncharacterized protein n=1 Tax=uncultured Solirubrobacteraceae bacterium TaxID=1162706 RepID=A0A6J4SN80_9ACTN|nr:MAG: hypothetical protein AVDCRST_MAG13-2079 [uncultured Solirubrobacteraceae bacterium]